MILEIFIWISMIIGLSFCAISILGLWRMPDVYTKQHALGLLDTLGIAFIMLALVLKSGFALVSVKPIFLTIIVAGFSAPVCYAFMQFASKVISLPNQKKHSHNKTDETIGDTND